MTLTKVDNFEKLSKNYPKILNMSKEQKFLFYSYNLFLFEIRVKVRNKVISCMTLSTNAIFLNSIQYFAVFFFFVSFFWQQNCIKRKKKGHGMD